MDVGPSTQRELRNVAGGQSLFGFGPAAFGLSARGGWRASVWIRWPAQRGGRCATRDARSLPARQRVRRSATAKEPPGSRAMRWRNVSDRFPRIEDGDAQVFVVLDVASHENQVMLEGGGS
jgi:hypothetical protein